MTDFVNSSFQDQEEDVGEGVVRFRDLVNGHRHPHFCLAYVDQDGHLPRNAVYESLIALQGIAYCPLIVAI